MAIAAALFPALHPATPQPLETIPPWEVAMEPIEIHIPIRNHRDIARILRDHRLQAGLHLMATAHPPAAVPRLEMAHPQEAVIQEAEAIEAEVGAEADAGKLIESNRL